MKRIMRTSPNFTISSVFYSLNFFHRQYSLPLGFRLLSQNVIPLSLMNTLELE